MVLAKEDFLWFKRGQNVPDAEVAKHPHWAKHLAGEIIPIVAEQPSKVESKKEEKKKK